MTKNNQQSIIDFMYQKLIQEAPELADNWRVFLKSILEDLTNIGQEQHFQETIQAIADAMKRCESDPDFDGVVPLKYLPSEVIMISGTKVIH